VGGESTDRILKRSTGGTASGSGAYEEKVREGRK